MAEPTLSIVVGSNGAPGSVEACLAALEGQVDDVEVIVCETAASAGDAARAYPWARFTRAPGALVPELWRDGIDAASGDVVALTISPMRPAADWVARIRERLAQHDVVARRDRPGARASGSSTGPSTSAATPATCGRSTRRENPEIPGDNAAYRRELLERSRDA